MAVNPEVVAAHPAPTASATDATVLRYARLLDAGTRIGMALLWLGFFAYVSGLLPNQVAPEHLPELWTLPVERYLELSGAPSGWQWLARLHQGDVLALAAIAFLAACSGACVASLLPLYRARGDKVFLALCIAQVVVLLLAASGLLDAEH
jgi:hypothetical protein